MKILCLAFDNAEMTHRKAHGIMGNKWDQAARKVEYESFCAARRRELAHILPPAHDDSKDDWHFYWVQRLLRLLPGDDGYVTWTAALHSFYNDVIAEAQRFYGDEAVALGAEKLAKIEESFLIILDGL
ncbi:hypothetical protein BDW72DRAFT_350 [Aspergillus terricola var. indicus]